MIRAGTIDEITPASGKWVYLDIGFSNNTKSCGLLIDESTPEEVTFSDAVAIICNYINNSIHPVNLVIEAPLSVAFDAKGNPKGRSIEKRNSKTRYWYVSLGTAVMVAALYLMKAIMDSRPSTEVRLFEGFVSFKKSKKSNHSQDVLLLRDIVKNGLDKAIIMPESIKLDPSDHIQSAFLVTGIDLGVPPILVGNG